MQNHAHTLTPVTNTSITKKILHSQYPRQHPKALTRCASRPPCEAMVTSTAGCARALMRM